MSQNSWPSTYPRFLARTPRSRPVHRQKPVSARMACGLLLIADVVTLIGVAVIAYAVWLVDDPYSSWHEYALAVGFGTLLAINIFHLSGLYEPEILTQPRRAIHGVTVGWTIVALILVAVSFLTKTSEDYSRLWALLWTTTSLISLVAVRWLFFARTARWVAEGRLQRRVAIVGTDHFAERLVDHFKANPEGAVEVVGVFAPEHAGKDRSGGARRIDGVAFGGGIRALIRLAREEAVDTVIIADTGAMDHELRNLFDRLSEISVDVRLCPGPMALELTQRTVSHYAGVPMLNVMDRPLADWRYAVKEVEDRLLATVILALISPAMLAIAIFIKLDSPGPVFFRQKRYGYNNHLVEVLKFRTMRHDQEDSDGDCLTQRDDPRLTRFGAFLRRWSLDELPQFINVLRGEMSIVGPRPHAVSAKAGHILYQDAVPHYASRHRVKPGITGWAQINGWRGTTETVQQIEKRVEHDIYYIENWSLWLDLKIILLTISRGFSSQNAY